MPGTRPFFAACLGLALLLLIALPALGGLFAPHPIPDDVAQGFRIWQADDCAGCHTLNGQGGAYAPDLTRIYSLRSERYLREFLLNSATFTADANHTMTHVALPDGEVSPLLAFLKWTDENSVLFLPQATDENTGSFRSRPLDLPTVPK